jgi:hypothetical protein
MSNEFEILCSSRSSFIKAQIFIVNVNLGC